MSASCDNPDAANPHDKTMLIVCGITVILAFLLQVQPDQRVHVCGLDGYPLPQMCMSQNLFGVNCPGCGLTRSLVYLAGGHWQASLQTHRIGWLMGLAILLQFPYRISKLRNRGRTPLGDHIPRWFGRLLIFMLIASWGFDAIRG